ncbi:MAG: hypothetical protein ACKVQW_00655 [Pyrinomonadaceae bacterium]
MKHAGTITIFLFLVLTPVFALAQSAAELGLVLKAIKGSSSGFKESKPGHNVYSRKMVIENTGKEAVIILNPTLAYGTGLKQAKFCFRGYDIELGQITECSQQTIVMSEEHLESFKSMVPLFQGDRPSENMTITLNPGESFSFFESFHVEKKVSQREEVEIDLKYKGADGKEKILSITKRYLNLDYVQLTYEFSFLPYAEDPDLLEKMSRRWRRFGRLPVGTNGTYTITSEPIK